MNTLRVLVAAMIVCVVAAIVFLKTEQANASTVYLAAKSMVGLHESKNRKSLQRRIGVNPRRTPWCGAFIAYVARKAGHTPVRGHLRAISWRHAGRGVKRKFARKGDIVVIRTRRGNHVTIFAGWAKNGRFYGLGGNQSNQVKVSTYRTGSIVAIRRLK